MIFTLMCVLRLAKTCMHACMVTLGQIHKKYDLESIFRAHVEGFKSHMRKTLFRNTPEFSLVVQYCLCLFTVNYIIRTFLYLLFWFLVFFFLCVIYFVRMCI